MLVLLSLSYEAKKVKFYITFFALMGRENLYFCFKQAGTMQN